MSLLEHTNLAQFWVGYGFTGEERSINVTCRKIGKYNDLFSFANILILGEQQAMANILNPGEVQTYL